MDMWMIVGVLEITLERPQNKLLWTNENRNLGEGPYIGNKAYYGCMNRISSSVGLNGLAVKHRSPR
jgi:hypothetical protein